MDFYDDVIAGDSVQSDNVSGSFQITEHLLQSGCRKIAFVGSVRATSSIMDRYLGYCRALLQAGIEPRADWRLEDRDADGSWIPLCLPKEMPDGFVCNCDEVAFNLVEKLKKEGYRIPEDIAVTGYDDHRFSTICTPPADQLPGERGRDGQRRRDPAGPQTERQDHPRAHHPGARHHRIPGLHPD